MTKKKLIIGLVVFLLIGGYAAKTFAFATPPPKLKINGVIYVLGKDFTINLSDGHYATLTVALELAPTQSVGVADATNPPPTGFGTLADEAVVRAIITNLVTDANEATLLDAGSRARLEHQILIAIRKGTDVQLSRVWFTDLAVQ